MALFHRDILIHQIRATLYFYLWIPFLVIGSSLMLDSWGVFLRLPRGGITMATASILMLLGLYLIVRSTKDLARHGNGTPSPHKPARELVTQGSYAWCRHPMHLGYLVLLAGVLMALCSLIGLLLPLPLLVVLMVRQLRTEEHNLINRFGDRYRAYQQAVPFLIPFLNSFCVTNDCLKK